MAEWHRITDYIPYQGDIIQVPVDTHLEDRPVFVRTKEGRRPGQELCGMDKASVPRIETILSKPFELVGDAYVSDTSSISCSIDWTTEYDLEFTVDLQDVYVEIEGPTEQHVARARLRRLIGIVALGLWVTDLSDEARVQRGIRALDRSQKLQEAEVFLDAALECKGWDEAFQESLAAPSIYRGWPRFDAVDAGQLDRVSHIIAQARSGGCAAGEALGTNVEIPNWSSL